MKYIVSAETIELDGYKYIKAHPTLTTYGNIDRDVDDASAVEIVAKSLLEYAKFEDVRRIVLHLASKLRHGGEVHLHFTSLVAVTNYMLLNSDELQMVNENLFGKGPHKRNVLTRSYVEGLVVEAGLEVIKRRIEGTTGVIVARRR